MFYFSPLEQFEIIPFYRYSFILHIDSSSIFTYLLIIVVLYIIAGLFYSNSLISIWYQYAIEFVQKNLLLILTQRMGEKGITYFPLFIAIFLIIFIANFLGLFPFNFTITSHIVNTFAIAFSLNLGFIIVGFYANGLKFFNLFVPRGVPNLLIPLITLIELFSYLLRTFSLSIRLCANMMAGHTLLHILTSFIFLFCQTSFFIIGFIPLVFVFLALGLELGVALLQAYVFFTLTVLYLLDSLQIR